MRRRIPTLMLFVALGLIARPVQAQLVDLTDDRTAEQKWQRTTYLTNFVLTSGIAYAKSVDQTTEHFARFFGELAGPSWGSQTPAAFVRVLST